MPTSQGDTDFFLIEKIFNQLSSSVSIALMRKDRLIYEFYGGKKFNAVSGESRINQTTRFNIGTASTLITGAIIVKLMEFGALRLNDKIKKYIPEFKFPDITVFHLLTHTSGLCFSGFPMPDSFAAKKRFFKSLYAYDHFAYETGMAIRNFPYGYAILADVAEHASGQTIDELASGLLFLPLGMNHTTFGSIALTEEQFVMPWSHRNNRFMTEMRYTLPTGQNGIYSTALDLIRFGRVFLNHGEFDGRQVFLESSVDFVLREITGNKFLQTPLFMFKGNGRRNSCFSKLHSAKTVAQTGDTGCILFIDPVQQVIGAALANSTWVNDAGQNYSNICDILMSI